MGAAGLEQGREVLTQPRVAERRQEQAGPETAPRDGAQLDSAQLDLAQLDGGRPRPFDPRMLLGLQAAAGNAAVSSLLLQARQPAAREPPTREAPAPVAVDVPTAEAQPGSAGTGAENLGMSSGGSDGYAGGPAGEGVAIEDRPRVPVPSLEGLEPGQALGVASALPPGQFLEATGAVARTVDRAAGIEHERLSREPPSRSRHPGAPSTVESPASERVSLGENRTARAVTRVPSGHEVSVPTGAPLPPTPALPASLALQPPVTGGETGKLSASDGQRLATAIARLPGGDVGLRVEPGPVPRVPVAGNADPNQVTAQQGHVELALGTEHAQGLREAGMPLGEDEIYPVAPVEVLSGRVETAGAPQAGGEEPPEAEPDAAISTIAQQERGPAIQAAAGAGISELAAERRAYSERTASERASAEKDMTNLERANFGQQAAERGAAQAEVAGLRGQWSQEQQALVERGRAEGETTTRSAVEAAVATRTQAESEASAHYREGQEQADAARREGERHALEERAKAQSKSSGGFLGLLASAARSVFDAARSAVQTAFERARQLVRTAIERAQQLAQAVIERARQTIVAAIRAAGDALTAIGDRVLVAFPALRGRFRQLIRERVARAEAAVNRLSLALRQGIQAALNFLGGALAAIVARLRSGMQAVVSRVRAAVQAAVDFARSAIAALGTFAVLVRDVAANPGRWLANLAAAAQDGIRNHLWPDLKLAVRSWFSDKVESVVGLGQAAWSLLRKGGITAMQIAGIAWEGLQSLIPPTIVWILVEKLVALIVPAAAAVMLIIQALQAAWGSVGRIIQAFDAFMAFLKGVRWGNAGPLFGKAVAAGAIAVIEFVSQFLLQRLMGGAGLVAGKLRALAKRIGKRLAGVGRGIATGARWVGSKLGSAGRGLEDFAGKTVARPQARWHAWKLGRELESQHPTAFEKLRQVKADPSLDPRLKVEFLKAVRRTYKPGVNARELMTNVVRENRDRFCLQGKVIPAEEISQVAPLTKLIALEDIFDKELLTAEYRTRFTTYAAWRAELSKNPASFDPRVHMKSEAQIGRWWSPLQDANEPSLEDAIEARKLSDDYRSGAVRVHLSADKAAESEFRKPTALDAMFFDPWQPPPSGSRWGFIKSKGGLVTIREAVTEPITASSCTRFELLISNEAVIGAVGDEQLANVSEALP